MLNADQIAHIALGVVVVVAVAAPAAAVLAWLLRRAGLVGGPAAAAVLGGAIAGVLLGATVMGKAAPGVYEAVFVGGVREAELLEEARRGVDREIEALRVSGVTPIAIEEHRAGLERKISAYADRAAWARARRSEAIDSAALLLTCAVFALGAAWAGRMRRRPMTGGAVASGVGTVLGAGIPVCIAAAWLGHMGNTSAWALGAAMGIGSAWPTARARRHGASGRSPETDASAMVALLIGLAAVTMATISEGGAGSFAGAWSAAVIGVALVSCAWRSRKRRTRTRTQRRALGMTYAVIAPALTAVCAAPIDWSSEAVTRAGIVAMVAALLFASDGRFFGAWIGWRLYGDETAREQALRRASAALANNVGIVSIGVAALGRAAGVIDGAGMIAIIFGALIVETTVGLRLRFARMLDAFSSGAGATPPDEG